MQTKRMVQVYEQEKNEVSYLKNVGAEGGTTPCSPYIEIMHQKTTRRHQPTKGVASTYNAVDEQTAHLVLDDAVVLAIALAEEVLEGADSLLLLALRQLVDVLAAVLPVRRLDEDRDERPLEVTGVAMAEGDGGVGPAAGLLAESGVEVLEELPGGHGFGGAERTVGESIRFVVHVLGGQLVVNLAFAVGLFLY